MIPKKKVRQQYQLRPGQKLVFIPYKNSLRVVIVPSLEEGYGFLEGLDREVGREEEDPVAGWGRGVESSRMDEPGQGG